jgi:hypothetical protein
MTRWKAFKWRKFKIKRLGASGGPVERVLRSGISPSVLYPVPVYGLSNVLLKQLRSSYGTSLPHYRKGGSITLSLAVSRVPMLDPMFDASLLPILAWSARCFSGSVSLLQAQQLFLFNMKKLAIAPDLWKAVSGPSGAFFLVCDSSGHAF